MFGQADPDGYAKVCFGAAESKETSPRACGLSGQNRRLPSIFDSCRRNEVSNFRLGQCEQVGPFCEPNEAGVDINNMNSLDNSGSNETIQKVLASIV